MTFESWLEQVAEDIHNEVCELTQLPVGAPALGSKSLVQLEHGLRRCLRQNEAYFRLSFGLALMLALGAVAFVVAAPAQPGTQWLTAGLGVSAFGAMNFAMQKAREKQTFDVMLELAVGLDEDAIRQVLNVLLAKYAAQDRRAAALPPQIGPTAAAPRNNSRPPAAPIATLLLQHPAPDAPSRASLRLVLAKVLKTAAEFDRFSLDHFPSVHQRYGADMDRILKENLLIEKENRRHILEKLASAHPKEILLHTHLLRWDDSD